jgi:hypothetical protein
VRGTVLPRKTENQAQRTRYWSPINVISEGHGGDVLDEGEVVLTRLGGVDNKIECGGRFCPAKPKTEHSALGIGLL